MLRRTTMTSSCLTILVLERYVRKWFERKKQINFYCLGPLLILEINYDTFEKQG